MVIDPSAMTLTMSIEPPTASVNGVVVADGGVGEHRRTAAADVDTAPTGPAIGSGLITFDGTVNEHQCPTTTLDAAAIATLEADGGCSVGSVVIYGAVDDCQWAAVANAAATVSSVVTDSAVLECQCAKVSDATATFVLYARFAVLDRHISEGHSSASFNEKDTFGGFV